MSPGSKDPISGWVFAWLLILSLITVLAQERKEPVLQVFDDLVLQENRVSQTIAIEALNVADGIGLNMSVVSETPALLPEENLVVSGKGPKWTLKITPGINARGNGRLRVNVTGPQNLALTKTVTVSVVGSAPSILDQLPALTVPSGATAEFSVTILGSEPLTYQWQFNNQNLTTTTEPVLRLPNVAADQIGDYRVIVSNPLGNVTSENARLDVIAPPVIATHPASLAVAPGVRATFSVVTIGQGPFTFQWRRNGINVQAETNSTLTIASPTFSSAGIYSVVVKGPFGALTSKPATLQVETPAWPLSDSFESRLPLPADKGALRAANLGATAQDQEPDHAGKAPTSSVWASWTAPENGVMRMNTAGSSFDTVLAAYTGSSLAVLQEEASDDDVAGFFTSAINFTVVKGKEYQIVVDGLSGASGAFILSWEFEAGALPVAKILRDPISRVVQPGNFTLIDVEAVGVQSYQWELNASDIPGGVSPRWRVRSARPEDVGNYQVKLSNGREIVFSQTASIQLGPDPNVASKDKFLDQILLGEPVSPINLNSLRPRPRASWRQGAGAAASGFRGTQVFSSVGSTTEVGEPNLCGIIGGASQWFTYESQREGVLIVSTEGSDFDTLLGVFTGPGTDFESLVLVACDNNGGADRKTSKVRLKVTKGTSYYIAVDGVDAATGNVQLAYVFDAPASVVSTKVLNDQVQWVMFGLPGVAYRIQASVNLAAWETVGTTNSPNGTIVFSEPRTSQKRFYRVVGAF